MIASYPQWDAAITLRAGLVISLTSDESLDFARIKHLCNTSFQPLARPLIDRLGCLQPVHEHVEQADDVALPAGCVRPVA